MPPMTVPTNPKFLIVDDCSSTRRVLRCLLREIGFHDSDEAEDGSAALTKLWGAKFDFVVTDVDMPTMNGFELLNAVKSDGALKHIPVLLVASEATKEQVTLAARIGAAGFLVSPFDKAALAMRIRRAWPALDTNGRRAAPDAAAVAVEVPTNV
jgi:two-component system chemotaxis response regulator CheY